jgi:hypothetical protein
VTCIVTIGVCPFVYMNLVCTDVTRGNGVFYVGAF